MIYNDAYFGITGVDDNIAEVEEDYERIKNGNNEITTKSAKYGQGQYIGDSFDVENKKSSRESSSMVKDAIVRGDEKNRNNKQSRRNSKELDNSSFSIDEKTGKLKGILN